MPYVPRLGDLVRKIATANDPQAALELIAQATAEITESHDAFVAALNVEAGHLEIRARAGGAISETEASRAAPLPITTGKDDGIVSYVAATGETFVSGNVREVARYRAVIDSTESEMAIPVRDRNGRVVAVLNAEADRPDAYNSQMQAVADVLASLVSMVLERETDRRREEALMQVASAITSADTEANLIQHVVKVADEVLRLQACSIFLIDPVTDTFTLRGTSGDLRHVVGRIAYARGEGFTGWVCDKKEPILLHEPQTDPRWRGKYVEISSELVATFLAVPIVSRGVGIGAIRVLRRKSDNEFLDNRFQNDDLRLLQAVAEQIAIGLETVRTTERKIRDERMVAWGELSAKSSHMIGNRVFALKGDLNELGHVLRDEALDRPTLDDLHRSLNVNLHRIEEILHDFRDFVTATQLDRGPTDLIGLLRETTEEVFPKRGDVALVLHLNEPIPNLMLDGKRLRRAFSELIENSLLHTPSGTLTVSARTIHRSDYEQVRDASIEQWVEVVVSDTGPGVAADRKAVIFQPFFSGRAKGMGLGLSIVNGIVEAHGGIVFENGELGQGARFVILLPLFLTNPPTSEE